MTAPSPASLVPELASHANLASLVSAVREHLLGAATELQGEIITNGVGDLELDVDAMQTAWGNLREVLSSGPATTTARSLLAATLALALRDDFPSAPETEKKRATEMVRFAAHHRIDALSAVDAALGDKASSFWAATADVTGQLSPAEAVVAVLALKQSTNEIAVAAVSKMVETEIEPGLLKSVLSAPTAQVDRLSGELTPSPRHPALTIVLALTGLLFVIGAVRLLGRLALAYRRPAQVTISERGVEVMHRTELLGRVLRDRSTLVPLANIAKLTREVRFTRVGLYAGLIALCLGTYLGMGLLVDGARVPGSSPPLLGLGIAIIAIGIALDFGLSLLTDEARGRCRLVVVPRKGRSLCVGALDPARADALLQTVAQRASQS